MTDAQRSGVDTGNDMHQIRVADNTVVEPGDRVYPAPNNLPGVPAGASGRVIGRIEQDSFPDAMLVVEWVASRMVALRVDSEKTRMHSIPVGTLAMRASEIMSEAGNRDKVMRR